MFHMTVGMHIMLYTCLFVNVSDDCEEVEALTQEVIADMEETFGEPLQKYFN